MVEQKIRSFLAVRLDDELIREIGCFVEQIKARNNHFRFIPSRNWHITLHFFGDLLESQIDPLVKQLLVFASQIKPFSISLKHLGGFPSLKQTRILWTGTGEGAENLISLKHDLDQELTRQNFPIEIRPFHPHITIACAKELKNCVFSDLEKNIEFKTLSQVNKITLFRSQLSSGGAEYEPIQNFAFLSI